MKIACLTFNPIQENTYVVWDDTKECAVIDAGNSTPKEDAALDGFLAEHGLKPVLAVNTHGHFDHVLGVEHLRKTYGIPFALSGKDKFLLDNAAPGSSIFGVKVGAMPSIDLDLDTTDEVRFGHTALKIIPTPGHTPGSVCLLCETVLFSGDTLFAGSYGRTDFLGGSSRDMAASLKRLSMLPPETRVLPGHGPSSTIEEELRTNPYLRGHGIE